MILFLFFLSFFSLFLTQNFIKWLFIFEVANTTLLLLFITASFKWSGVNVMANYIFIFSLSLFVVCDSVIGLLIIIIFNKISRNIENYWVL